MKPLWGIDLGGTKVEGVIIDRATSSLKVVERLRLPTEKEKGYEHIIAQIAKTVELLAQRTGLRPTALGIGTPGATEPATGLLKNSNTTALNGMPFKSDLERALNLPIEMANDANCFAVAEANLGIAKELIPDAKVIFGIIMGTGVGGGVVIDGQVINGKHNIAGEWGHNYLDDSGGLCYCGKTGCVEKLISGTALEAYYKEQSGLPLPLKQIIERYYAGEDEHAQRTVNRLLHFFGKGVSSIINILATEAIVLGGGLGNIDLLYSQGVQEIKKHIFNSRLDTLFLRPKLGDSAGVFGAALLTDRIAV